MAKKQRRTNTSVSVFGSLLETIGTVAKVELKDDPEALAKVDKMVADAKDSNITTALDLQDDAIGAMHDADDAAEEQAEPMDQADEQTEPTEPPTATE